jgi:hypothetical protein
VSLCNHVDIILVCGGAKCSNDTINHHTESFLRSAYSQVMCAPLLESSLRRCQTCLQQVKNSVGECVGLQRCGSLGRYLS